MSGDITFYTVERILLLLEENKGMKYKHIYIRNANNHLDGIEESRTGCQTYIDEYREQLKKYEAI